MVQRHHVVSPCNSALHVQLAQRVAGGLCPRQQQFQIVDRFTGTPDLQQHAATLQHELVFGRRRGCQRHRDFQSSQRFGHAIAALQGDRPQTLQLGALQRLAFILEHTVSQIEQSQCVLESQRVDGALAGNAQVLGGTRMIRRRASLVEMMADLAGVLLDSAGLTAFDRVGDAQVKTLTPWA